MNQHLNFWYQLLQVVATRGAYFKTVMSRLAIEAGKVVGRTSSTVPARSPIDTASIVVEKASDPSNAATGISSFQTRIYGAGILLICP
jgi:hypothetical protein